MDRYLLSLANTGCPENGHPAPCGRRLARVLKCAHAHGFRSLRDPVLMPTPGAQTPAELVAAELLSGEGLPALTPEDVAALEALVRLAGRRALAGLLICED